MWHANSGGQIEENIPLSGHEGTPHDSCFRGGCHFNSGTSIADLASKRKEMMVMRCLCFWTLFMTVRPWTCLNRGNFMLKIVVLRQLSVLEMKSPHFNWLTSCHIAKPVLCIFLGLMDKWIDATHCWSACERGTVNVCNCECCLKNKPTTWGNICHVTYLLNINCIHMLTQLCLVWNSPSHKLFNYCKCYSVRLFRPLKGLLRFRAVLG